MAEEDKHRGEAAMSGGSGPERSLPSQSAAATHERAEPQHEPEPEKERLERLRSVLERKSKLG